MALHAWRVPEAGYRSLASRWSSVGCGPCAPATDATGGAIATNVPSNDAIAKIAVFEPKCLPMSQFPFALTLRV